MESEKIVRVGSRKSELALVQTRHVISLLKNIHPNKEFEIVTMSTLGDKILDIPLPKIGEKSLFTKELETALAIGGVDFVVHSLKDLPTVLPARMAIGAVLEREDPRDALVLRQDCQDLSLETLPQNSVIGTSSLRRTAQLAKKYPHLKVESIRGNLNTRLRKLDELGSFNAIILAAAGLHRMGWNHRISKIIEDDQLMYAVGQGALAVECREDDGEIISLLSPLYDAHTALRVIAERSFLKTLGGGCSAPVAVTTNLIKEKENTKIALIGAVWSLDGREEIISADEAFVVIKRRCAVCPYKCSKITTSEVNSNLAEASTADIECLNQCAKRVTVKTDNVPTKKQKLSGNEIPTELLKNDPHEQLPMNLPVGVDFMGKCPYLESNMSLVNIYPRKCPVYGQVEGDNMNLTQCPFREKVAQVSEAGDLGLEQSTSAEQPKESSKLYVGLVPHIDIPIGTLDKVQKLGVSLAERLIQKGAGEVMAKAQAVIRGS